MRHEKEFEIAALGISGIIKSLFGEVFDIEKWMPTIRLNTVLGSMYGWEESKREVTYTFINWMRDQYANLYFALLLEPTFSEKIARAIDEYKENTYLWTEANINDEFKGHPIKIEFTAFSENVYTILVDRIICSLKNHGYMQRELDYAIEHMRSEQRDNIAYVVCNFMFVIGLMMHDKEFLKDIHWWMESITYKIEIEEYFATHSMEKIAKEWHVEEEAEIQKEIEEYLGEKRIFPASDEFEWKIFCSNCSKMFDHPGCVANCPYNDVN